MKIFDDVLINVNKLIDSKDKSIFTDLTPWENGDEDEIIFKNDTAYELGENSLPGISGILFTDKNELVGQDEVVVLGDDLSSIKEATPYARIVLVNVNEAKMGEGNAFYQALRRIDYTRYHVYPKGFMVRISSMNQKESVRVSKEAIKNKISFARIGKSFIDAYKKQECVNAVKIIFITKKDFPYDELKKYISKGEDITKALDHLVNKVKMDCHSCKLQLVCNEVENMVKEDFKKDSSK